MLKERSGPNGPDHVAEPREIVAPDATSIDGTPPVDHAQPGADAPLAGTNPSSQVLGSVVYDSGWEDCSGIVVRTLFTEGPPNRYLRDWVREKMLRLVPPSGGDTEAD